MTLDPDPLHVEEDPAYRAGFIAGLGLRPTKLGLLCLGIALGLIAGIIIGRSTLAATPRPSAQSHGTPVAAIPVVGQPELRTGGPPRLGGEPAGAPQSSDGGPPTSAGASLAPSPRPQPTTVIGEPACYPAPCRTPNPAVVSRRFTITREGLASTYGEGYDGWIAWPDGPGYRLLVCGSARCVTVTSNDAGPDKAEQRAGRVIDLDTATFEAVCGCNWRLVGLAPVHVTVLRAPR